tara:strand:- start:164 stop:520 length:357 start_codon:yes stop_codon:yes gene_type:complete|eukprot:scaffold59156_cov50-Phaeocystis_antarctica.AAC.1
MRLPVRVYDCVDTLCAQAAAGLADIFPRELIVTAADVPKGKPAPDIYIEAARRIGVRPEDCRAYEDGESGLISAFHAGCQVVDVTCAHEYPSCEGLRVAKRAPQWSNGRLALSNGAGV